MSRKKKRKGQVDTRPVQGESTSPGMKAGIVLVLIAVVLAISFIALNASYYVDTIKNYNDLGKENAPAWATVEVERRSIFLDIDCQIWNLYASEIATGKSVRIRRTDFDNHPWGREVHWSSGYAWLLAATGWLWKLFGDDSIKTAVEQASLLVNPVLYMILITLAAATIARRFSWLAGVLCVLALAGSGSIQHSFHAGGPDHHSLVTVSALGAVLCLFLGGAGFVRKVSGEDGTPPGGVSAFPSEKEARRWFVASGIFVGAGLWVSAISMTLLLVAIGSAAVLSLIFCRGTDEDSTVIPFPEIWIWWGAVGAGTGFLFYLVEYFPNAMSMHLEVNNPLYHFALLGGSWLIVWIGRLRLLGRRPQGREWLGIVAALAVMTFIPVLVVAGDERFYALRNDLLWRWHENIFEFHPISVSAFFNKFGVMVAVMGVALTFLLGAKLPKERRAWYTFAVGVPLVPIGLTFWQQRWGNLLAVALVLPLLAGTLIAVPRVKVNSGRIRLYWKAGLLTVLVAAQFAFHWFTQLSYASDLRANRTKEVRLPMFAAAREVAEHIRRIEGHRPVVLFSSPWPTVVMCYSGGFKGIGSLYWENLPGIQAVADILTETDDGEVLRLVRERGITHMAFMQSDYSVAAYYYNKYGRHAEKEELDRMFGNRLKTAQGPWWIRQLPYSSAIPKFNLNYLFFGAAIFRIDPRIYSSSPSLQPATSGGG